MRKYYKKLCKNNDGQLKSICGFSGDLIYPIGEWVYPQIKGSKLFVFDTLENARKFYSGSLIYECEVIGPVGTPKIISDIGLNCLSKIQSFWIKKCKHKKTDMTMPAPIGTRTVNAIKLLREVY